MKSRTKKVFLCLLQEAKPQNTNSENRANVNVSQTIFWCFWKNFWTTFFSFFQSPSIHCSEISWAKCDFYVCKEAQGISLLWTFCMEFKGKCKFLATLCQVIPLLRTGRTWCEEPLPLACLICNQQDWLYQLLHNGTRMCFWARYHVLATLQKRLLSN